MPSLDRGGASIHYEVSGSGPAVVLGHSLLCDVEMWAGVVPRLAQRHRVINVEVRGHRRSTAPGPFTLEDLADDWLAVLDRERVDRAFLVGLSMGGMTALRVTLRAPARVAGMVILDSSADAEPLGRRAKYALMEAAYQRFGLLGPLARRVAAIMFARTTLARGTGPVEQLRATIAAHDRRQLARAMRAVFGRGALVERLAAVACPTLVLVGEEDVAQPPEVSRRIAAAIPGARIEVLPGCGHLSAMEDPDGVARRVLEFLDAHGW